MNGAHCSTMAAPDSWESIADDPPPESNKGFSFNVGASEFVPGRNVHAMEFKPRPTPTTTVQGWPWKRRQCHVEHGCLKTFLFYCLLGQIAPSLSKRPSPAYHQLQDLQHQTPLLPKVEMCSQIWLAVYCAYIYVVFGDAGKLLYVL